MYSERITSPSDEPLTVDTVKLHCRIDGNDDDNYLAGMISEAREFVEDRCRIAVMPQAWRLTLDGFPQAQSGAAYIGGVIHLPRPPLASVQTVRYRDAAGVMQAVDITDESSIRVSKSSILATVSRPYAQPWPVTECAPGGVEVDYTAGYANADLVPQAIKRAMLLLIGHWYKNREAVNDKNMLALPLGVDRLLAAHIVPPGACYGA